MTVKNFLFRLAHWETWHYLLKYLPMAPVWLWYCARSRSLWFFSSSNPTLTFGGFEGESKKEMYAQLPPDSYPASVYISPCLLFAEAENIIHAHSFSYPFAVKPDVGMMGYLFRKIDSRQTFKKYHEQMPVDYIVQEFIDYPLEVSVFYCRYPNQKSGTITGFLKKEFPEVTGDGISNLRELIRRHGSVRFRMEEMLVKHKNKLEQVLPTDEVFCLSPALNLSRGGKLVSLQHEIDSRLLAVFDRLSHYTKYFYYGRYDIKCASVEDLKNGQHFSILEFNGSGAEPHHIYGNNLTLIQAYRIVWQHWKILYQISKINHHNGVRYWGFRRGFLFLKKAKRHFKKLKKADLIADV